MAKNHIHKNYQFLKKNSHLNDDYFFYQNSNFKLKKFAFSRYNDSLDDVINILLTKTEQE